MSSAASGARQLAFSVLRALFRAVPMPGALRDRLRNRGLDHIGGWSPPPPRGRTGGTDDGARVLVRADERAIGYAAPVSAALPAPLPATLVAFYLPQFHPFAENDAWWGKGFTEWRNVSRALPQFEGHAQPRLPGELGFYDLRVAEVMREQARLASDHGIGAFCFYFYWFSGRTLMEQPLRQWLADSTIELPFCLCWANENWTRRWDGRNQDVLIGQQHSAQDDLAFIAHVADYLRDRRALKVDGRPVLLLYRPQLLPDPKATAARWRGWCRDNGIGEIHLAYVQSFERPDPRDIGFDAAVEFPPNIAAPRQLNSAQFLLNPDYAGDVRDWRELAAQMRAAPLPDYPLYPGVNPGWDNEARRPGRGRVLLHASPRGYGDWLHDTVHGRLRAIPRGQRLVFINAWNEWAESAVLEPDARLGHAWLQATRQALSPRPAPPTRPCIVIHAWYLDVLEELLASVAASGLQARLVITTDTGRQAQVQAIADACGITAEVWTFDNHGRDILPFLHAADRLLQENESLVLKLHTKRSTHRDNGDQWRRDMVDLLLGPAQAARTLAHLQAHPDIGLMAPAGHLLPVADYLGGNAARMERLWAQLGLDGQPQDGQFASGSMYWARLPALRPLLDAHLLPGSFEAEAGQIDGTLAHAIERATGAVITTAGYRIVDTAQVEGAPASPGPADYPFARRH
ncbi:glycoside hydrolase family 99-like domain-containing protein [Stenotrophomonas sp. 24(2023)]|uniref:glycoside hydrolase family 99-like domain-containing protein n=1 Tax=Stenotrophomonas sp. 24(2023) TaxID=3068324 RepID=UPI0027E1FE67|nr:glycoside hydrolase family 99-like domain-containing protein [Stenotrophomonas sp. 24(2023)]WMJ67753.1 glycoside hydrolase family 99-like domain-containing protein [Stenotrophomonas sp. 24(2023)]